MNPCIETLSLSHSFGSHEQVVKDLYLKVPKGSIYGFLGPNGAGKTTTLRLLLGLIKSKPGSIRVFGETLSEQRVKILSRTGCLIESPSLYAHLSASENLNVWATIYKTAPSRIQEVLEIVDLIKAGKKKAGQFSLGMKQRLALAAALLHSPELLILDEPTNGLDPQGIIEMRSLLRKLNTEHGITILISSHMLSEIEKLVSHIGIIHKGEMRFQGTWEELQSVQRSQQVIIWNTSDNESALNIVPEGKITGQKLISAWMEKKAIAQTNKMLMERGIDVYELHHQAPDLENIFLQIIK